jgi:hypothetical protein
VLDGNVGATDDANADRDGLCERDRNIGFADSHAKLKSLTLHQLCAFATANRMATTETTVNITVFVVQAIRVAISTSMANNGNVDDFHKAHG